MPDDKIKFVKNPKKCLTCARLQNKKHQKFEKYPTFARLQNKIRLESVKMIDFCTTFFNSFP